MLGVCGGVRVWVALRKKERTSLYAGRKNLTLRPKNAPKPASFGPLATFVTLAKMDFGVLYTQPLVPRNR